MTLELQGLRLNMASFLSELSNTSSDAFLYQLLDLRRQARQRVDIDKDALLCCLFLDAIFDHSQNNKSAKGHLYLEKYEIPQIKLFDILISKFPFVSASHTISNKMISEWIKGESKAAVLDIGIGRGLQMCSLINELAENTELRELTIIGIEPFGDALIHARQLISEAATNAAFKVNLHLFEGFAETVNMQEIKKVLPENCGKFVINASLAVHHIPSITLRKHFFKQVSSLNPDAIVLTEPHSDHMTDDWAQRTANAWIHYGAIFDTIDSLHITREEKNGLKMFFGREIKDVVSTPDSERFERHEPCSNWLTYCMEIGMVVDCRQDLVEQMYIPETISLSCQQDVIMMKYQDTDVLAVIPMIKSNGVN